MIMRAAQRFLPVGALAVPLKSLDKTQRKAGIFRQHPKCLCRVGFGTRSALPNDDGHGLYGPSEVNRFSNNGLVGGLVGIAIIANRRREHDEVACGLDLSDDPVIDLTPGTRPVYHRGLAEALAPERQHDAPSQPKFPSCLKRYEIGATSSRANNRNPVPSYQQIHKTLTHERYIGKRKPRRMVPSARSFAARPRQRHNQVEAIRCRPSIGLLSALQSGRLSCECSRGETTEMTERHLLCISCANALDVLDVGD